MSSFGGFSRSDDTLRNRLMELMDVESTMTREEKGQIASESRQAFFVSQIAYGFLKTISATSFASNITRQRLHLNSQDLAWCLCETPRRRNTTCSSTTSAN